jgi:cytochrome c oxidase subunit 2
MALDALVDDAGRAMRSAAYALAMALLSVTLAVPAFAGAAWPASINITASNWKFTPGTITVHVNQATTLHFNSKEGVHGVASRDLGITNTFAMPTATAVTFTPHKRGTYVLHCTMPCGQGHAQMTLVVKVVR